MSSWVLAAGTIPRRKAVPFQVPDLVLLFSLRAFTPDPSHCWSLVKNSCQYAVESIAGDRDTHYTFGALLAFDSPYVKV